MFLGILQNTTSLTTFIFLVLLVSNIQCEKGYHLMNDEEENAKEVYDFFKGPGITSENFYLLDYLEKNK